MVFPVDKEMMGEFWKVYQSKCVSEGTLKLIDDILEHCEGHYTVWRFRRFVVTELEIDLMEELKWARKFAAGSPKNYQVWHHRAWLLQLIGNPVDELDQMIGDFLPEPKNYHAWQYRQWILQTYEGSFTDEIRLVDELLRLDVYNNSAWNHRHFVYSTMCPDGVEWKDEEVSYTQAKLKHDPANEAALQYLKWLNKL